MYCTQCGNVLEENVAFCPHCGAKQSKGTSTVQEHCKIKLLQVDEKWSLFGKDIFEFQVFLENGEKIMSSERITLCGFEYNGPKEKNPKHKRALDKLLVQLLQKGWHMDEEKPAVWYELSFWR